MPKNPLDHSRLLDARDDLEPPTAAPADLDVDSEYPLQALRPRQRPLPAGGRWLSAPVGLAGTGGAGLRHDPGPIRTRRREHALVRRQVRAGFWHQRGKPRDEILGLAKIAGSDFEQPKAGPEGGGQDARTNIACVVPSRYGVFSAKRTSPPSVSDSLSVATGGLET
jgi:hypothetical protein